VLDPADVEAELEVSATVRRAAAAALAEAESRLKSAEDAQRALKQQLQVGVRGGRGQQACCSCGPCVAAAAQ
jgi:hypothetical protein